MHTTPRRSALPQERRPGCGGEPAGHDLAMAGEIVWLVVVPAVVGLFLGRQLDAAATAPTGLPWTGAGLLLGTAFGAWLAWRWTRGAP